MRFRGAMIHHSAGASFALALHLAAGCSGQPAQARAASTRSADTSATQVEAGLQLGAAIPDVKLTLQDGFGLSLAAMKGKPIAVFFCSASSDPACVKEAEGLRDHWEELHHNHNLVIVGVSPEPASAHQTFIAQHALHFDFASDPNAQLAQAFKVPMRSGMPPYIQLFGRDGTLRATWRTADPALHAREMLATIRE